jgi:hypothetical protein
MNYIDVSGSRYYSLPGLMGPMGPSGETGQSGPSGPTGQSGPTGPTKSNASASDLSGCPSPTGGPTDGSTGGSTDGSTGPSTVNIRTSVINFFDSARLRGLTINIYDSTVNVLENNNRL